MADRDGGSVLSVPGGRGRRAAFTLVELLVVIGVILVLLSVLLPTIFAVKRNADRSRTKMDLQTISIGLEEYKKVFKDYPRQFDANKAQRDRLLVQYLIGPNAEGVQVAGTFQDESMRGKKGGKKWGPYIPPDKFKYNADMLLDRNGMEIVYYPKYNSYDRRTGLDKPQPPFKGYLLGRATPSPGQGVVATEIRAMFNVNDGPAGDGAAAKALLPVKDHVIHTLYMLGDGGDLDDLANPAKNPNNQLDAGESLTFDGPFILVSAGPDKQWGLYDQGDGSKGYTRHSKVDDVYNFDR